MGLALGLLAASGCSGTAGRGADERVLSVADFGAVPNDGRNDAAALRAAIEAWTMYNPSPNNPKIATAVNQ